MERPWHERSIQLEAEEGPYCDYAAWREWFSAEENKKMNPGDILGEMNYEDVINLYCIFCDVYDAIPDLPLFVEAT